MLLTHLHCRSILLHDFYIREVTVGQIYIRQDRQDVYRFLVEKLLGLRSFGRQSMHSKEDKSEVNNKHVVMITGC